MRDIIKRDHKRHLWTSYLSKIGPASHSNRHPIFPHHPPTRSGSENQEMKNNYWLKFPSIQTRNSTERNLNESPLITKVTSLLKVQNPLLETTDWKSIDEALGSHISSYWKSIRESTPYIANNQRGGWFLIKVGFQGWKLHCQTVVSIHCNKPENMQNTYRN